jgi:hypothetical protein
MNIYKFKPTFLYIKQHSITGLKYFGKTVRNENELKSYYGSGTYWKKHINIHGKEHVSTIWFKLFNTEEELVEYALNFSNENDIVNSIEWANLTLEDGLNRGRVLGFNHSEETKIKISKNRDHAKAGKAISEAKFAKNFHHSDETKQKLRDISTGKIVSEETKIKLRKPKSDDFKHQVSLTMTGVKHETVECPHCHKIGGIRGMKRYHFDNCKLSINSSQR